ncbi:Eco57I restriction-modification methylase domain-containing protein [Parasphaerochaeta coccoides]|uniref:Helicase A859L n=1 Tax=Parasphaerochaeta coccoides (strain ATCC BAA-1237 / DSM 17374 / SPN1) TaxID=760011 RepID=F4GJZ4_PARC1|nr:Eco57I restriction-modification methylase domain-containing protein [Parasphaerochaeta coccoides]AEC01419.1 helicase A859L [Parasphaerochaeta coccoides DSM 17374]
MSDKTVIKTTKTVYPQIYAYVLLGYDPKDGWIKIGYTERKDVDSRIKEQTHTAAVNLKYSKLWSEPARFSGSDVWFKDKQLHAYLRRFKKIAQEPNTEWFYYDGTPQQAHEDFDDFRNNNLDNSVREGSHLEYQLRHEQELAVEQTLAYAKDHPEGEFLWNAKPRFGKTLTTYDLVRKMEAQKILVVTNRPAIANSWYDDFETFIAWQTDYRFVSTTDSLKERPVLTREKFLDVLFTPEGKDARCIAFISLQDLKGAISFGGMYNKLTWVKDLEWDVLVIDEAHEGVDTFKTDIAFNNIKRKFTLHLSGTPFKAVASGRFSEDQIFNWTYADEQDAKAEWSDAAQNNPYERLPRLNLFSYQMSQMITDEVNQGANIDGKDVDFAFDLNEFFETNDSGNFVHEAEVSKWLDTLTRNEKYPFSTKELRDELRHTFWLLNRIASAKALAKLLKQHPVFENYGIILAAGDGRTEDDPTVNEKSLDRVRAAIKAHGKTITLSVGQLTTGVTVPEWSAVLMLSNVKSPSLYMQAGFRAQNPWDYEADGEMQQKQNAYIFDFAPERTLIIYDEFANNLNSKTVSGGGTTVDRETHIKTLLNFFPVIAEDDEGKMVELDVRQVLTIPKALKAREVVRRGFMSNLLFQNISGIFASSEAREILGQLNPVDVGKVTPRQTDDPIDTQGVQVDGYGDAMVPPPMVLKETEARFGEKVYADIIGAAQQATEQSASNLINTVATAFTQNVLDTVKELAKDSAVTMAQAEQVVKQNANIIAREVEVVQKQAEIKQAEAKVEFDRQVAVAQDDKAAVAEAKAKFEATTQKIQDDFKKEVVSTVAEKTKELTKKSTETILKKAEEKKKTTVEDDIRARLRGFARTIPSFLMAYGTPDTTLANFDENIKDVVFKEVTGITLDQFRTLRDTYEFFDGVVFNESIQEFLHKKEQLADYFDDSHDEDIFDYIPPQKTNQIYTPRKVVKLMIDKLEEENPDIFTDKDKTFADLYVKSGLYLTEIVKRLYTALAGQIPDEKQRIKHILENQIYGFAPSEIIYNIARNFIFGSFANINDSHLQCRDLTEMAKTGRSLDMKFDVVVGNPPYQDEAVGGSTSNDPIYNHFYNLAELIAPKYCLISPARFLSKAGYTPKTWNEQMLNDENLKVVYYEQKSALIFPNTDIKGGVVVLLRDKDKSFGKIGTFTNFEELNSILFKVSKITSKTIETLITGRGVYRLTNIAVSEYPQIVDIQSKGHKYDVGTGAFKILDNIIYFEDKPDDGNDYVQILGLFGGQRVYRYIRKDFINCPHGFTSYKVILPKSNGTGAIGEILSTPLIGEPLIGFTETFISIGAFNNSTEAENCLKYVKSKFARTMLGVLKVTQDNPRDKWSKVPLQDFTPQSDIDWTKSIPEIDKQLYAKYGLDEKEIAFIEEKVAAME